MSDKGRRLAILLGAALAWFIAFPEDAEAFCSPVKAVLGLTIAISPELYGVIAVSIIATAIVKTWGRGS